MPHILIVDDERHIRTMLSLTLRRAGHQVTVAADGFEAMMLCISTTFDAVLADVDMPRMNGHELVRWVAVNRPETPYALMSALNLQCEDCPVPGRCLLLHKPFFPRDAVALINQMLNA
jgi:CheY-like chemotaxis protein